MISRINHNTMSFLFLFVCTLCCLSACIGTEDNKKSTGIVLHVAEVHTEIMAAAKPASISNTLSASVMAAAPALGGYDKNNIEHHDIQDKNGRVVSVYRAYIVIDDFELIRCPDLTRQTRELFNPRNLFNGLIPNAQAHSGHGSEPVGNRALDAPNVIDIITQDEFFLPLGDIAIAPGSYCSAQISLVRLASVAYGKPDYAAESNDNPVSQPEIPDMSGLMYSIRADYCSAVDGSSACITRTRVDIDDGGLPLPAATVITFPNALVVSKNLREGYVAIGIAYGQWLEGIDITQLNSDANEQQKLAANIAQSLYLYQKGLGDLP